MKKWSRPRVTAVRLLAGAFVVLAIVAALILNWPRGNVTRSNFARIQLGMSDADVVKLLGREPDTRLRMLGRIVGPDQFTFDGQKGWYLYREWYGPNVTIITVSDLDTGQVLCRYSAAGKGLLPDLGPWRFW